MYVDTNSGKLKVVWKIFGLCIIKNGCGHSGHMNLKLAAFKGGINWIKWFFCMFIQIQGS